MKFVCAPDNVACMADTAAEALSVSSMALAVGFAAGLTIAAVVATILSR